VSALVIVVPDLYLAATPGPTSEPQLPGLAQLARLGNWQALPQGWRSWLAESFERADLAAAAPAAVAAAECALTPASYVWFATPLHLLAGLAGVYLDPRGLLKLDAPTRERLRDGFDAMFAAQGYRLLPGAADALLAVGPQPRAEVRTTDPARYLGASIEAALPAGAGAPALRQLGSEIEMWLHEHPLNQARARARLPAVSTLWLWGGGVPLAASAAPVPRGHATSVVFSDDPFVVGLSRLAGVPCTPGPRSLTAVLAAQTRRAIVTLELFQGCGEAPAMPLTLLEVFDRDWVVPALAAVRRGALRELSLVANDRRLDLGARAHLRFWRRRRGALAGLT
jgi:hypothetical protein